MENGEICAWHYATRKPVRLCWQAGRIVEVAHATVEPPHDLWLASPLFDLQINGFGGVDFQQDDLSVDHLLAATRQLRSAGCTRFLLTLITDEWSKLIGRLKHLHELRNQKVELKNAIVGWHIEGPFLSAEPGFHGAHNPRVMLDPNADHIRELRAATATDPVLLTLAPERPGALEAIALAVTLGIKISLGHTNASAEVICQAVRAGASGFTHLGNACPQQLDRHDNILWRALDTPSLAVSLIPDQIHVSPSFFRLVHRVLKPEAIYYTTDAMAAAGAPPGRYTIGPLQLEVGTDQIVRHPGKTNFAGSALQPIDGVFRAAQMLGCPWQQVWPHFSSHPAKFMGMPESLELGQPADFCLLKMSQENQLAELQVWISGNHIN